MRAIIPLSAYRQELRPVSRLPDEQQTVIFEYLRAFDVRLETTQETPSAPCEDELTRELITMVTVFSARLYGRRSQGLRKKIAETIHTHTADRKEVAHGAGDENPETGGS